MGCVLHFSGPTLDVDGLLSLCPVEPCTLFRKGEPLSSRPNSRLCAISGLNIEVSDADFDNFEQQQADAIQFLAKHHSALMQMRNSAGVDSAAMDFGIAMRNVISQSDTFDADLISVMAPLRLALVLSQYPVAKKSHLIRRYRRALRKAI